MQSAVAALLFARLALNGYLIAAQQPPTRRTCLEPSGVGLEIGAPDITEVVDTPQKLQNAVGKGTKFIFITSDLDMRDLPVTTTGLNCGVLKATTTAVIQVRIVQPTLFPNRSYVLYSCHSCNVMHACMEYRQRVCQAYHM